MVTAAVTAALVVVAGLLVWSDNRRVKRNRLQLAGEWEAARAELARGARLLQVARVRSSTPTGSRADVYDDDGQLVATWLAGAWPPADSYIVAASAAGLYEIDGEMVVHLRPLLVVPAGARRVWEQLHPLRTTA